MKTEKQIQNDILRTFGTRRDMRIWRQNTGVANFGGRTVAFGVPGAADLTGLLNDGTRLEIEVKNAAGRQTPSQVNYENMITDRKGIYILARSVDDVHDALAEAGYETRNNA